MRGSRLLLTVILAVTALFPAAPALAKHRDGPCHLHRQKDETVQSHMRRIIRCAVGLWEVEGGVKKALCIARAESGLNPRAVSPGGTYLGLYQHHEDSWEERYRRWTKRRWGLDEWALSGRTNAIVTIRMVHSGSWSPWAGVGGC